jgi:predicted transcriptional regulator
MPLTRVYQLMQENGCDYVTVVESYAHQKPIGIITEHDICMQVVGNRRDPRALTAANVMNTNIIKAPFNLTLADCFDLLETNQAKQALIVNEDGMFCGTLTQFDLEKSETKRQNSLMGGRFFGRYDAHNLNRIY